MDAVQGADYQSGAEGWKYRICKPGRLTLDGKPAGTLPLRNASVNGLNYLHVIADGAKPGPAIQLISVEAEVK